MINKAILLGNIGSDPETRTLENGSQVASFSLATSENYKDKDGEWQSKTEWHRVVGWGKKAEQIAQYAKGQRLYIEGKMTYRQWEDKDGNKRTTAEVNANYLRSLDKKESSGNVSTPVGDFPTNDNAPAETTQRAEDSDDLLF